MEDINTEEMPLVHRDISWLAFNHRVLQEAEDSSVPLFERLKFMAIYSSNLNEFFRVRVAHHRNLMRVGKKTKKKLEFSPKQTIKNVLEIVNWQQEEFSRIFEQQLVPELAKQRIRILRRNQLNEQQQQFVQEYFSDHLLPFVQPVLLKNGMVQPFLNNAELYLSIYLIPKNLDNTSPEYAIVKVPSDYSPRFVELPAEEGKHDIIMLDDVVRHNVSLLFPGYRIDDTYSIKLSRDAELYLDDEFQGDLVAKIRKSLTKRNVGPASRFVYDRDMPEELLTYLMGTFNLERADLLREGRYHNNFDFFKFPSFGKEHLKKKPLPPLPYSPLEKADNIFDCIQESEHLLHFPYQSYDSVTRFFEEAAKDPQVTHIKIIQYRVSKKSKIMNALIKAAKAGKQVMAFVEVKARFDEEANLRWAERLEKAGVKVYYSFPGLKVHSKLALITRETPTGKEICGYLSTGNFHEDTATLYGDFGLFTSNPDIISEVKQIFGFLETVRVPQVDFEHLLVGQFNLRRALVKKIDRETKHAFAGRPARMILKMNSLEDKEIIAKLYQASQAGVQIDLIVRGICCLVPGIKGYSENISVISIVDRFLEHARVFWFSNGGKKDELYLSSADFMRRNLSYRIETAFPIYNSDIKKEILDILHLQLSDNVKARRIDEGLNNHYVKSQGGLSIRSQIETYYRIQRAMEVTMLDKPNSKHN